MAPEIDAATSAPVEAITRAAESVGQDQIGTRVDEALVQQANAIGVIDIPQFRRIT